MPRLSISSWSLHRALGPTYRSSADSFKQLISNQDQPGTLDLLDLPARIAARGIKTLEICHFHLPSLDDSYLAELRAALDDAGVELFSILIDAGDITQPDAPTRQADLAWIENWLAVAGQCGAGHARIIAGDAALNGDSGPLQDHPLIRRSAANLRHLAAVGRDHGVQIITENFRRLTTRPEPLLAILALCEGQVGLCADFGNFHGDTKYDDLAQILPLANSVHAKADYPQAGQMRRDDFLRCLDLSRTAGFTGPYSLIFDGPGSEWDSLAEIQAVVEAYL